MTRSRSGSGESPSPRSCRVTLVFLNRHALLHSSGGAPQLKARCSARSCTQAEVIHRRASSSSAKLSARPNVYPARISCTWNHTQYKADWCALICPFPPFLRLALFTQSNQHPLPSTVVPDTHKLCTPPYSKSSTLLSSSRTHSRCTPRLFSSPSSSRAPRPPRHTTSTVLRLQRSAALVVAGTQTRVVPPRTPTPAPMPPPRPRTQSDKHLRSSNSV